MVNIRQNLVTADKYAIKCPYEMQPEFIVVHNTANDASANNEIAYMLSNNNKVSFHYAVDDVEIVQGIEENRNAWHAGDGGNGEGNRKGIAIEICYSKSGGEKFDKAEENAAEFIAYKLKEKGWGIDKVKKHQDFSNKYCPHRTLDLGWERFLNKIRKYLGQDIVEEKNNSEEEFEKIQGANQRNIGEDFGINTCKTAICDGYSLEFDDYLKETLGDVVSGRVEIFYVDSFKGLTRNFEKILHVLQIVLQHENAFVTCNYYISNGRIEKRKKILRAFHSEKDMFDNMRNLNGLPTFFRDVLLNMML